MIRYGNEYNSPGPENVVIPNGVTEIGDSAFWDHYEIKSVSIPKSVKKIGDNAFWGCSSLNSIEIPASVITIGKYALGWDRDGSFHSAHTGFIIYGKTGSAAERYAADTATTDGDHFIKFYPIVLNPHPYATALIDHFNDATGETAAYLEDINGDGVKEMLAYKSTSVGGESYRLFYLYKGKLYTYDKESYKKAMFFSTTKYLVSYDYFSSIYKGYQILTIKNGKVTELTSFGEDYEYESPYFQNHTKKISKSTYKALQKKYGVSNKNLFIEGTHHINRPDQTKQILAMTTNVNATGITLNKTSIQLEIGKTYAIKATIAPTNATKKSVKWSSSNAKVATVDKKGNVKAIGKGTATITVTATDGSKVKKTCTVKVK